MGQWGDSEIKIGLARFLRHYTTKDCFGPIQPGDPVTYVMIDDGGDSAAAEAALAELKAGRMPSAVGDLDDTIPPTAALSCIASVVFRHLDPTSRNLDRTRKAKSMVDEIEAALRDEGFEIVASRHRDGSERG